MKILSILSFDKKKKRKEQIHQVAFLRNEVLRGSKKKKWNLFFLLEINFSRNFHFQKKKKTASAIVVDCDEWNFIRVQINTLFQQSGRKKKQHETARYQNAPLCGPRAVVRVLDSSYTNLVSPKAHKYLNAFHEKNVVKVRLVQRFVEWSIFVVQKRLLYEKTSIFYREYNGIKIKLIT